MKTIPNSIRTNWFSVALLIIVACLYCAPALIAPFWGNNDGWSNLLPIIHYRISILNEHTLPIFTTLWYSGRHQWQNPLWSFLYFPATLVWLITPLDWGARIVLTGHLIFSLLTGRKLASLFLSSEINRISAAIVLTSPMLPSLLAIHIEKTMGWGWLLFSIYFLLNERYSLLRRGIFAGLCWGIMALTGDNYHILYAGLLLIPLTLSFKKISFLFSLWSGAFIGLFHLPSVWYLVGFARSNPGESIPYWSMDFLGILTSLATGLAKPVGWETWALIGGPLVYLFIRLLWQDLAMFLNNHPDRLRQQKIALLISLTIFILMAVGVVYKGHHLLDTFRVPARAVSLVAVTMVLYILMSFNPSESEIVLSKYQQKIQPTFYFVVSALQIGILSVYFIQPTGALHSPYDSEAQKLAAFLNEKQAKSVWHNIANLSEMYLDVVLTQQRIALQNVYYGDMGQQITTSGSNCGYSFDYLINPSGGNEKESIMLVSAVSGQSLGAITYKNLKFLDQVTLDSQPYDIYHVVCNSNQ